MEMVLKNEIENKTGRIKQHSKQIILRVATESLQGKDIFDQNKTKRNKGWPLLIHAVRNELLSK